MGVLGNGSRYNHHMEGRYAPGIWVPNGSLDRWFTRRSVANAAASRVEVVVFGDSTSFGAEAAGDNYSWVDRVRDRCKTAGYTDGGKGIFGAAEVQMIGRDVAYEVNGVVSTTFTGDGDEYDNLAGQYWRSMTGGETLTLQGYGSTFRLWYSLRITGDVGVSIDGGSETVINTRLWGDDSRAFAASLHQDFTGLNPAALHTVTITNKGGATIVRPAGLGANPSAFGGSLSGSTQYYYVVTTKTTAGETRASNVATSTPNGETTWSLSINSAGATVLCPPGETMNVYRSTSSAGPFGYLGNVGLTGGNLSYTDDGTVTPNMAVTPPVSDTAGRDASVRDLFLAAGFMFDTGVVWNKQATTGDTFLKHFHGTILSAPWTGQHAATRYQTPLGLTPTNAATSPTSADGYAAGNTPDTSYAGAARIQPTLAMVDLGFNDLTSQSNTDYTIYTEGIKEFGAACRAIGSDGIVIHGNQPYNAHWPTYGAAIFAAMKAEAFSQGLAFVDFWQPFGGALAYTGGTGQPHLPKSQYQQQGDFLWDNLLGL